MGKGVSQSIVCLWACTIVVDYKSRQSHISHARPIAERTEKRTIQMKTRLSTAFAALVVSLMMLASAVPGAAWASVPPLNDDFDSATVVTTLPFTDNLDTSGATSAADDRGDCGGTSASVWY